MVDGLFLPCLLTPIEILAQLAADNALVTASTIPVAALHCAGDRASTGRPLYATAPPWRWAGGGLLIPLPPWPKTRVLFIADVIGGGLGDRVIAAQFAHALVAAEAEVTVLFGCPQDRWHFTPQQHTIEILRHLYPKTLTPTTEMDAGKLATFDYVLLLTGHTYEAAAALGTVQRMRDIRDYAQRICSLDLLARCECRALLPFPGLPLGGYIVYQVGAQLHQDVLLRAAERAAERAAASNLPLVAIGLHQGEIPTGFPPAIDACNTPLPALMAIIKDATEGFGPDSGPAHLAGFYGRPWTAFRHSMDKYPWWWQFYPTTRCVSA